MPLLGCIPDAYSPLDLPLVGSAVLEAPPVITSTNLDLRAYAPEPDNQIEAGCCAHTVEAQAVARSKAQGRTIARGSVLFLYANAILLRNLELTPPGQDPPPLVDVGSSLRYMYRAVAPKLNPKNAQEKAGYGMIAAERWPEIPENINVVPPDDCYVAGENCTISKYRRIDDGPSSITQMRACLERLHFPTFCMMWDDAAANIGGKIYDQPGGKVHGGHCVLCVAHFPKLGAFLMRNSHGKLFGMDGGYFLVSERFVATESFDKWDGEVIVGDVQ